MGVAVRPRRTSPYFLLFTYTKEWRTEEGPEGSSALLSSNWLSLLRLLRGFDLKPIARRPIATDFRRALEAEARGFVVVVDDVSVFLGAVIPEQDVFVDLPVKGDGDLLVALANGGRLELGDALLEIGAAIAPEVGGLPPAHGAKPPKSVTPAAMSTESVTPVPKS